jgi:hypothetical protein
MKTVLASAALCFAALLMVTPVDARNHTATPGQNKEPAASQAARPAAATKSSPGVGNPTTAPTGTNNPGQLGR